MNTKEIVEAFEYFEDNLTKKDIKIFSKYLLTLNGGVSLISKALILTFPSVTKDITKKKLYHEMYRLRFEESDNNSNYNFFKYYYPFDNLRVGLDDSFDGCAELYDTFYYSIRKQMMLCSSKEEIIKKLKYDRKFYFEIADTYYKAHKDIWLYTGLVNAIMNVGYQLVDFLSEDDTKAKDDFYENFRITKIVANKQLSFA
jgi:hypothetical protein